MKFKTHTPSTMPPSTPSGNDALAVAAHNPLRRGLGVIANWRVNAASSAQRVEVVREIDAAAINAAADVTLTAIEQRRAEQKAALAAAGVMRYGAIAQELLLRTGIVQEQLTDVQFEAYMRQVGQRASYVEGVKAAHDRGELSVEEYELALTEIAEMIVRDNQRFEQSATRVKDAVSALAESAAGHIARGREGIQSN